jgi:hypothetical protein
VRKRVRRRFPARRKEGQMNNDPESIPVSYLLYVLGGIAVVLGAVVVMAVRMFQS